MTLLKTVISILLLQSFDVALPIVCFVLTDEFFIFRLPMAHVLDRITSVSLASLSIRLFMLFPLLLSETKCHPAPDLCD